MAGPTVNLVKNGGFEQTYGSGYGVNLQLNNGSSPNSSTYTRLADWNNGGITLNGTTYGKGLNLLVAPGWTSTGASDQFSHLDFNFYTTYPESPNKGEPNGFSDSPAGGNYIAADGEPNYRSPIWQAIDRLTVGQEYAVSFLWAAGQQLNYKGGTYDKGWNVTFGDDTQQTNLIGTDSEREREGDFSGWFQETMRFTASSSSQTLLFLAQGMPSGLPPFLLLDDVSVQAVPEPSTMVMLGSALDFVGLASLRRRRRDAR